MIQRRPKPSSQSAAIPSLTALLAAGAQLAGCHAPTCAPNRAGELAVHGHEATSLARTGHASDTLHALAIATGLTIHPQPPPSLPPDVDGGMGMIDPTPPPPVVAPPPAIAPPSQATRGGLRPTTVTPPTPPTTVRHPSRRAGHPPPTPPQPYEPHMLGDMGAVMAVPPTEASRRPA